MRWREKAWRWSSVKALDAVGRGDVSETRAPEGERVDERLAQDDLVGGSRRGEVEHAAVRSPEIEMERGPRSQPARDLPPVEVHDASGLVTDRNHERAVEVLVA